MKFIKLFAEGPGDEYLLLKDINFFRIHKNKPDHQDAPFTFEVAAVKDYDDKTYYAVSPEFDNISEAEGYLACLIKEVNK